MDTLFWCSLLMEGNPQFAKIFTELSKGVSKQVKPLKYIAVGKASSKL